jgi:hypothetical protein
MILHDKTGGFERLFDLARVQARVPDISDRFPETTPRPLAVILVVIDDLAQLARIEVDARSLPPRGIETDAIGRVGHHQVRAYAHQQRIDVVPRRAVAADEPVLAQDPNVAARVAGLIGRSGTTSGSVSPSVARAASDARSSSENPIRSRSNPRTLSSAISKASRPWSRPPFRVSLLSAMA